jgi:hypothetical protein
VVFGLSFYTIPKITPLGFVSSTLGSWLTAFLYLALAVFARPPPRLAESFMGFIYCVPVIGIFNTIAYYSEYNARERFVFRRRLNSESISLAVARICTTDHQETRGRPGFEILWQSMDTRSATFLLGLVLWGAFTVGGWVSFPDQVKFVDKETGWAWFSHCAGMTAFLLIMTGQIQWLVVIPVFGSGTKIEWE